MEEPWQRQKQMMEISSVKTVIKAGNSVRFGFNWKHHLYFIQRFANNNTGEGFGGLWVKQSSPEFCSQNTAEKEAEPISKSPIPGLNPDTQLSIN